MPSIGVPQNLLEANPYSQIGINQLAKKKDEKENEQDIRQKVLGNIQGVSSNREHLYKKDHNKLGKDEFLKLLTHQLQNQDPMKPTEQHKFISDLAQFAQLEQLTNIRSQMDKNKANEQLQNRFYAASFLGKKVFTSGSTLNIKKPGQETPINFNLTRPAEKFQLKVFDKDGDLISISNGEKLSQGNQSLTWNGKTIDDSYAAAGEYSFQIKAWDENAQEIEVETKTSGIVSGVNFNQGEFQLLVNGKIIPLNEVSMMETESAAELMPAPENKINGKLPNQIQNIIEQNAGSSKSDGDLNNAGSIQGQLNFGEE